MTNAGMGSANHVQWATLIVAIVSPLLGYFLVGIYSAEEARVQTNKIEKQITILNTTNARIAQDLRITNDRLLIAERRFSISEAAGSLIKLSFPNFHIKYIKKCQFQDALLIELTLNNVGEFPIQVGNPTIVVRLSNGKTLGPRNITWSYVGPVGTYFAHQFDHVYFIISFVKKFPRRALVTIRFAYQSQPDILHLIEKMADNRSLAALLLHLSKGMTTMHAYIVSGQNGIPRCKYNPAIP